MIDSSVKDLKARFSNIESIIIKDPVKALEIPLLRMDIERIQELNQSQIAALKQDLVWLRSETET